MRQNAQFRQMLEDKWALRQPDGSYEKIDKRGKKTLICAQDYFCEEAVKNAKQPTDPVLDHVFIPAEAGVFSERD